MSLKTCESILQQLIPPVRRACLLVPELTLSILSSANPLWHIPYEEAMQKLDRSDPWWAFLWPGSQALSRYRFFTYNSLPHQRISILVIYWIIKNGYVTVAFWILAVDVVLVR